MPSSHHKRISSEGLVKGRLTADAIVTSTNEVTFMVISPFLLVKPGVFETIVASMDFRPLAPVTRFGDLLQGMVGPRRQL